MYGAAGNRLLKGFEYTASYNLGNTVPFVATVDTTGKYSQTGISPIARGMLRPIYEMVYNHYRVRRGLPCPYTEQAAAKLRPEGAAIKAALPVLVPCSSRDESDEVFASDWGHACCNPH